MSIALVPPTEDEPAGRSVVCDRCKESSVPIDESYDIAPDPKYGWAHLTLGPHERDLCKPCAQAVLARWLE